MKTKIILTLVLIYMHSLFAAESDWERYRIIMDRDQDTGSKVEEIPRWMLDQTQREEEQIHNMNRRSSFENFVDLNHGRPDFARMGNDGPNGGDTYGAEFASLGFEIYHALLKTDLGHKRIDLDQMEQTLKEVIIYSDEGKYIAINNQPVDALNFPKDKKILINREHWREMTLKQKLRLVFHEYMGIMDVERNVYKVSMKMNKFFDDLVLKLKDRQDSVQLFYGKCDANMPLSFQGDVCSLENAAVKASILCAKEKALKRCLMESYKDCVGQVVIRQQKISASGMASCQITSIVK